MRKRKVEFLNEIEIEDRSNKNGIRIRILETVENGNQASHQKEWAVFQKKKPANMFMLLWKKKIPECTLSCPLVITFIGIFVIPFRYKSKTIISCQFEGNYYKNMFIGIMITWKNSRIRQCTISKWISFLTTLVAHKSSRVSSKRKGICLIPTADLLPSYNNHVGNPWEKSH